MGTHPIFESDFDCLTEMLNVRRFLSLSPSLTKRGPWQRGPWHQRAEQKPALPDSVRDKESVDPKWWKKHYGTVSHMSITRQFENKFESDKFFEEREIWDEKAKTKRKIKLTPGLPFKVNKDPFSAKRAYDGIYDYIDIVGGDPSVTPHQLCHGHPAYRAIDLGIELRGRDQTTKDPRRHLAELRTLHSVTNYNRRYQYGRVENQWRRRYMKRVEWINRIS